MHRMITMIASYLKRLPDHRRNRIFELALLRLPLWLIRRIPCSYSTYLACYTPRKGDVILDCGAHIGNCALLFSRLVGKKGLVIAAEPLEKAFHILKGRIQRLKLGLFGDCKTLQACEGLRELRIDLGPGYRVYFARVGNRLLLLLAGGNKGSQKRDIQQATKWLEQYREENEREKIPQL